MNENNIHFQYVTTYIIGSGGDLSVGAPYCRGSPNVTFKVDSVGHEVPQATLSAKDMNALQNIGNISSYSQFISQYSNLQNAVQANMLGKNKDQTLENKINALSARIRNTNLSSAQIQDFDNKIYSLRHMAQGALRNAFTLDQIGAALRKS